MGHKTAGICLMIEDWTGRPGKVAGWLILALVMAVCVSVLAALLRISVFFENETALPLIGRAFSASTVADLQWHLFAVMVMLGGAFALQGNRHVQVDFLSSRFSPRTQRLVTIAGDLFLLLPFCGFMVWYGWKFAMTAYYIGEGSAYGGMTDRWIIKMVIPMGFGLIALNALARSLRLLIETFNPSATSPGAIGSTPHG